MRGVFKCLSLSCKHVFVDDPPPAPALCCPKCKNAPVGVIRQGDEGRWSLKIAKGITKIARTGKWGPWL